jgi:hypothetical protein
MSDFTTWRSNFAGRDSTPEQQHLADALDRTVETAKTNGMTLLVHGPAKTGQTMLICDWARWKIRTDPDARIVIVGQITDNGLHKGLLQQEAARLSASRQSPNATPGVFIIIDGTHNLAAPALAGAR